MVAHDGACARKAAQDCRPVTGATESMVHLWQPAGTVYYDSEVITQHHSSDVGIPLTTMLVHEGAHFELSSTSARELCFI